VCRFASDPEANTGAIEWDNLRRHLKTLVLILITAVILWRLWRGLNWGEVRQSFREANVLLVALAVIASSATNLLRAFRWRALLSGLTEARINEVFAAVNIGIGANFLFGGAVAELVRPLSLPLLDRRVGTAASFLTIVVERICDLSVLSLLFGASLFWLPAIAGHRINEAEIRTAGVILMALPLLGLLALATLKRDSIAGAKCFAVSGERWRMAPRRWQRGISSLARQLAGALRILSNRRGLAIVTLWTTGQWLATILANWLIFRAFGLPFGAKETVVVMCCGLVGSFVPTPGGAAGAFHAAISSGLIFLGATLEQAAAISITAHLAGFVPALVFGALYFLSRGVNFTQLQHELTIATEQKVESLEKADVGC